MVCYAFDTNEGKMVITSGVEGKYFDINQQNMSNARRITPDSASITVQQLLARTEIADIAEDLSPFAQLYIAGSPYKRELLAFYPSAALGRFVLESHITMPMNVECDETTCGAVVYDRGFLVATGLVEREEFSQADTAYDWTAMTLRQFAGRVADQNPLVGEQAALYLGEMHEQGHELLETHNRQEMNFALQR